jgi:transposase-like protein
VVTKLTDTWPAEAAALAARDLSQMDYAYLWVDGIHPGIRLSEDKLCLLVMIGVRADGHKELVALANGYRESAESWADMLRDFASRGMRAPVLAVRDRAPGFWKAVHEVFPQARAQRCWLHKIANVLGRCPESAHPIAKKALAQIWNAEGKGHARRAVKAFAAACGPKFPKAAAKITEDQDGLLAFCDCPAEHWVHLRTTNPIEFTFATVRLRTKVTKGHGSKGGGRAGHGIQADRVRASRLAHGQRPAAGRARPLRRVLRQRQAHRAARRPVSTGGQPVSRRLKEDAARSTGLDNYSRNHGTGDCPCHK